MTENYEGLIGCPATDGNFHSGIGRLSDEDLRAFLTRLVELEAAEGGHKGRIKAVEKELKSRGTVSEESRAVTVMAEDIKAAEELYGDGMPYELERIENELRFYKEQAGIAFVEMGKRLIRIKAHEGHGGFMKTLDHLEMTPRTAQNMMAAARRFSNAKSISYLGPTKLIALSVLDDDEVEKLERGEPVRGVTVDRLHQMTVRELRETLKKAEDALKKEKAAREKDREVQEKAIAQKEQKINELDQQLRYQQPPTKEQTALAALFELNLPYTVALAEVNGAVRRARALVVKAETIPGVDALMLNGWFNQYSPEMETFAMLHKAWTDEVDDAAPINVGEIKEADRGDVPELG